MKHNILDDINGAIEDLRQDKNLNISSDFDSIVMAWGNPFQEVLKFDVELQKLQDDVLEEAENLVREIQKIRNAMASEDALNALMLRDLEQLALTSDDYNGDWTLDDYYLRENLKEETEKFDDKALKDATRLFENVMTASLKKWKQNGTYID